MAQEQTLLDQVLNSKTREADLNSFSDKEWRNLFYNIVMYPIQTEEDKEKFLDAQRKVYAHYDLPKDYKKGIEKNAFAFSEHLYETPKTKEILNNWQDATSEEKSEYIVELGKEMFRFHGLDEDKYHIKLFNQDRGLNAYVALGTSEFVINHSLRIYNFWLKNQEEILKDADEVMKANIEELKSFPPECKDANGKLISIPEDSSLMPSTEKLRTIHVNTHEKFMNCTAGKMVDLLYHEFTHVRQKEYNPLSSENIIEQTIALNANAYYSYSHSEPLVNSAHQSISDFKKFNESYYPYLSQPVEKEAYYNGECAGARIQQLLWAEKQKKKEGTVVETKFSNLSNTLQPEKTEPKSNVIAPRIADIKHNRE